MSKFPRLLITISSARQPWKVPKMNRLMKTSSMVRSAAPSSPLRLPSRKRKKSYFQMYRTILAQLNVSACVRMILYMMSFPGQVQTNNLKQITPKHTACLKIHHNTRVKHCSYRLKSLIQSNKILHPRHKIINLY